MLVVDMQIGFMSNDHSMGKAGFDISRLADAIPGCIRVVEAARKASVPLIFTRFVYERDMSDFPRHRRARNEKRIALRSLAAGTEEIEIIPELAPRENDIVIDKSRPSSFYGTRLEPILTSGGIRNLVVCGVTTSMCVETTVRDAGQRDYWTFVVRDAVAEVDEGRQHYSLYNMSWLFADIVNCQQLERDWLLKTADTP